MKGEARIPCFVIEIYIADDVSFELRRKEKEKSRAEQNKPAFRLWVFAFIIQEIPIFSHSFPSKIQRHIFTGYDCSTPIRFSPSLINLLTTIYHLTLTSSP